MTAKAPGDLLFSLRVRRSHAFYLRPRVTRTPATWLGVHWLRWYVVVERV